MSDAPDTGKRIRLGGSPPRARAEHGRSGIWLARRWPDFQPAQKLAVAT